jgi:uncharacterized protein (DUF885 family)
MEPSTGSGVLEALAGEYWETFLETHPLFATDVGDPRFDDCLPDPTPEGMAACAARFRSLLARVDEVDAADLRPDDRVTLSALRESIASDVAELGTGLLTWNVNPLDGIPADLLTLPSYQRLETPEDGARMVRRWQAMGPYTDAYAATLVRSLADGRVACQAPTARTVSVLETILARSSMEWPLLEPLAAEAIQGWTTAEREQFAAALAEAVEAEVRPAFERLHRTLVEDILPVTRTEDSPGVCAVPGGSDDYRNLIRMHTSLEIEPAALHDMGMREIERIDGELTELAASALGIPTLGDALRALRDDPRLYFATSEEVFAKAASSLARAEQAAPAWFGRLPRARCEIVPMAEHEEAHSGAAYYRPPAMDGSREGQYTLNTSRPQERPRYEAEALAYHEAIPGHHFQIALAMELEHLPLFRRNLGPTAYFEGWGLYAERLAGEMGLYTGDLDRIGQLSFDSWRAARLVVDTGLHAMGWPRRKAVEFMLRHTALSPSSIDDEVDRYIVLPGQALAYKTGQLELLRLRDEARATMGAAFDVRAFHDTVLGGGALPLPTLRTVVAEWAARRLAPA